MQAYKDSIPFQSVPFFIIYFFLNVFIYLISNSLAFANI